MSRASDDLRDRIRWAHEEADRCERIGAHRLAAWWRAEARRLAA